MIADSRKFLIVFDLDGVICKPQSEGEVNYIDDPIEFHKANLECPIPVAIDYRGALYFHYFPPYLDVLFNYLISCNCRIAFFSAAIEFRNVDLLKEFLPDLLGDSRYEQLQAEGQFAVFSNIHLTPDNKKDISIIVNQNQNEDLNNSLLIEDQPQNAANNTSCIQVISLCAWDILSQDNTSVECLPKSNTYYLLGIFVSYFNKAMLCGVTLKEWLHSVGLDKQILNNPAFIQEMILLGLQEVQKQYPDAVHYGEEYFQPKKPKQQFSSMKLISF